MSTAPKDGTPVLACRNNGCRWVFMIVMWSEHPVYPWLEHPFTLNDNAYPEGRLDCWRPLPDPPYPISQGGDDE